MPAKKSTKRKSAVKTAGINMRPYGYGATGEFVPSNYWQAWSGLEEPEKRISEGDRKDLIAHSRNFEANMPEADAIASIFEELIVGNGLQPIFLGAEQAWASSAKAWLKKNVFPTFGPLGIATDWSTTWKMVFRRVYFDGDILMIPYVDRLGIPHCDFVEGTEVANRGTQKTVNGGRFDGYEIADGVIYGTNGKPIGYQVLGATPDDDRQYSTSQAFLITSPLAFSKPRGLPVLSSAIKEGYHLFDFKKLNAQLVKIHATVQLIETNEKGTPKKAINPFRTASTGSLSPGYDQSAFIAGTLWEMTRPGKHYQKPSGKLETLKTNSPAAEVQGYVTSMEKSFMLASGFPHQFLISPESIGGAPSRGIQDMLNRTILGWQSLLEKYALIALNKCLANGMALTPTGGGIATNTNEDWMNWSFSKASKLILDAGYERQADREDFAAGLISANDITTKNSGTEYAEVTLQNVKDVVTYANGLEALLSQLKGKPQQVIDAAVQRYEQQNLIAQPSQPPVAQ
jgi:hypothetical protein